MSLKITWATQGDSFYRNTRAGQGGSAGKGICHQADRFHSLNPRHERKEPTSENYIRPHIHTLLHTHIPLGTIKKQLIKIKNVPGGDGACL